MALPPLLPAAPPPGPPALERAQSAQYGPGASQHSLEDMQRWMSIVQPGGTADAAVEESKAPGADRDEALRRAVDLLRQAADLRPEFARGQLKLARALRLLGDLGEARAALSRGLWDAPEDDALLKELRLLEAAEKKQDSPEGATPPEARPLGFFKFPATPHVLDLTNGRALQESDRLLNTSDAQQFFNGQNVLIVEEKIDGANLGISLTADWEPRFQNRAKHVTSKYATQWKALDQWWEEHSWEVCQLLKPEVEVLFGEWTWQRHSVEYTKLPAYFVAFDIYNKSEGRFVSARERDRRLLELGGGIPAVPRLAERAFSSRAELEALLGLQSAYSDGPLEGIYLRIDEPEKQGGGLWNSRRGKIVRADFIQGIEDGGHFINKEVVRNKLA